MRLVSKMGVKESNTNIRLAHSDSKKRDHFYRRFVATESFPLERTETCSIYSPDMENGNSPSRLSFFSLCVLRIIFGRYSTNSWPISQSSIGMSVYYLPSVGKLSAYAWQIYRWSVSTSSRYARNTRPISVDNWSLSVSIRFMINYYGTC